MKDRSSLGILQTNLSETDFHRFDTTSLVSKILLHSFMIKPALTYIALLGITQCNVETKEIAEAPAY